MNDRSRSALFLIEQLIVITVFAVCAAICSQLFVDAYITSNNARDMNYALLAAKNGAEVYKAFNGNPENVAVALGGSQYGPGGSDIIVYYNRDWLNCEHREAEYALRLSCADSSRVVGNGAEYAINENVGASNIDGANSNSSSIASSNSSSIANSNSSSIANSVTAQPLHIYELSVERITGEEIIAFAVATAEKGGEN